MDMVLRILLLAAGFAALIFGADRFVEGSSALAKKLGVPEVVIGLTVVALGTSAPELAVSASAALRGSNEIALSNVIGSNTFNLLCVLGGCALLRPVPVDPVILKRDFPFSILTALLLLIFSGGAAALGSGTHPMEEDVGSVGRLIGACQLVLFAGYIVLLIAEAGKGAANGDAAVTAPLWKCLLRIVLGLGLVIAGGEAVVDSAKKIASALGMTETLIGLTVVAAGTSLPELVTSLVAAKKGESGLAVGNVLGSNIFNLLFILSVSALIHPVAVNMASAWDLCLLLVFSLLAFLLSLRSGTLSRAAGGVMLLLYAASVAFAALR